MFPLRHQRLAQHAGQAWDTIAVPLPLLPSPPANRHKQSVTARLPHFIQATTRVLFAQSLQPHWLAPSGCRAWNIGKKGELSEAGAREKAHKDRVTAILWHKNFLYSVSYDGCIKMWDGTNLELVMEVKNAHNGQRIQCGAVAPDGFLYTGGDDKASASCKQVCNFDAVCRMSGVFQCSMCVSCVAQSVQCCHCNHELPTLDSTTPSGA